MPLHALADLSNVTGDVGDYQRAIIARLQELPSVFDWSGASFDVRLQKALSATKGDLRCPPNDPITGQPHQMLNAVVGHNPTRLICSNATWGDESTVTGGNGGTAITGGAILWAGAADATAITFEPTNTGEILIGPAVHGFVFDGMNSAAEMVHFNNCQYHSLNGKGKRCKVQGARFSSRKGSSSNYSLYGYAKWHYDCGAGSASLGSHGLYVEGDGASLPTTQHVFDIFGNTQNGYGLVLADADNCHGKIQGYRYPTGTGGAIHHVAGGSHSFPSRNHEFDYVNGVVLEDSGCYGNRIKHYAAEGGGISSPNVWHGRLFDPVLHREFATPLYQLRDVICLPANGLSLYGSAVTDVFGAGDFWGGLKLPDAVNNAGASLVFPAPAEWDDGSIYRVEAQLTTKTSGAPATANAAFQLSLCCKSPSGSGGWGNAVNQSAVIASAIAGTNATANLIAFDLTSLTASVGTFPVAFSRGNSIGLNINRKANDASDTYADYLWLDWVKVYYVGKGPRGTGIGSIDIPPFA